MLFMYFKLFLAVMFGWLLYATLTEFCGHLHSLFVYKNLTYMDEQIGERTLELGKDSKRIGRLLLQHLISTAIFTYAIYLMIG